MQTGLTVNFAVCHAVLSVHLQSVSNVFMKIVC